MQSKCHYILRECPTQVQLWQNERPQCHVLVFFLIFLPRGQSDHFHHDSGEKNYQSENIAFFRAIRTYRRSGRTFFRQGNNEYRTTPRELSQECGCEVGKLVRWTFPKSTMFERSLHAVIRISSYCHFVLFLALLQRFHKLPSRNTPAQAHMT